MTLVLEQCRELGGPLYLIKARQRRLALPLSVVYFWRCLWHEIRSDFSAVKWNRTGFWLLILSCLVGPLVSTIILIYLGVTGYQNKQACTPDGKFRLIPLAYTYWGTSGFFQITLRHGDLTFAQAKAIDIVWDVVSHHLKIFIR